MARGSYRRREPKKPKKSKQKVPPPAQLLPQVVEPERGLPKRRPDRDEEEAGRT
jgi:hypothetical protein